MGKSFWINHFGLEAIWNGGADRSLSLSLCAFYSFFIWLTCVETSTVVLSNDFLLCGASGTYKRNYVMFFFTIFSIGTTGSSILFVQEKNYAYRVYKSVYFVLKISNFVEVIIKCMHTSHEHRINATIIT